MASFSAAMPRWFFSILANNSKSNGKTVWRATKSLVFGALSQANRFSFCDSIFLSWSNSVWYELPCVSFNVSMRMLSAVCMTGSCLSFISPIVVCNCHYTDFAVVLVTCVFSSGCCQRPERRKRRPCCLGTCKLLIVFTPLDSSRYI